MRVKLGFHGRIITGCSRSDFDEIIIFWVNSLGLVSLQLNEIKTTNVLIPEGIWASLDRLISQTSRRFFIASTFIYLKTNCTQTIFQCIPVIGEMLQSTWPTCSLQPRVSTRTRRPTCKCEHTCPVLICSLTKLIKPAK